MQMMNCQMMNLAELGSVNHHSIAALEPQKTPG